MFSETDGKFMYAHYWNYEIFSRWVENAYGRTSLRACVRNHINYKQEQENNPHNKAQPTSS